MMQKMRKWVVVLLVVSLFGSSLGLVRADVADSSGGQNSDGDWVYNTDGQSGDNTYYYYMLEHQAAAHPSREIAVDLSGLKVTASEYGDASDTKLLPDKSLNIVAVGEKITFPVNVPETGLYAVEMDYLPVKTASIQYLFAFGINGETPFTEANSCILSRVYQNAPIVQDEFGDDLRPQPAQTPERRKQFLYDQTGVYGTLYFYLEAGQQEISVCFDGTPLILYGITLKQELEPASYQDYVSVYKQQGHKEVLQKLELFQAENYLRQSSSQLWPVADKSSSLTQPFSYDNVKINYGGGSQWKTPGQWISWEIEAPETGFYNLGIKYRQGYLDGLFTSRKIYIDGEVPFKELNAVRFNYSSGWKNMLLGDSNGAYSIFLEKGKHTITMENVIGDLTSTMSVLQTVIADLNKQYLSVVMITSADPDPYRDYYLDKQLPDLPAALRKNADLLFAEAKRLEDIVGAKGAENAYFEDVAYNLQNYANDIVGLTGSGKLTKLKNDINGLSAKLTVYQEQALDIDYIALVSSDKKMPKTAMNVWEWIVYQVRSFFASFKSNKAAKVSDEKSIRVWISTGIDQFETIKNIITDEFSHKYGIQVDLELAEGSLVNALAAGTGPDVMLGVVSDTVVNLALRGAVVDLSQYEGYFDILSQYVKGAEVPFKLEGHYYGMPNTNGCSVMFIRTDIFQDMGLSVPKTWEDMYDVAQVLQRYNMTLGAAPSFANLLYQKGGSYFDSDENPTKVMFDEDVAIEAMVQHTEFFTKYGFPVSYDFANRFRTGEMPIGIADYSIYVNLKYTAPEISGLWEMYPMPGTLQADGTVNCTQMDNSGNGVIMLNDCKNKDAAWEFIKWWSDAKIQTRYANDIEACLGISARYATANLQTLQDIGWTKKELNILTTQFENLKFIPIVPGNYYVNRGVSNTIRGVVDHDENARELLTEWTIKINDEILRKRTEFNMNN